MFDFTSQIREEISLHEDELIEELGEMELSYPPEADCYDFATAYITVTFPEAGMIFKATMTSRSADATLNLTEMGF